MHRLCYLQLCHRTMGLLPKINLFPILVLIIAVLIPMLTSHSTTTIRVEIGSIPTSIQSLATKRISIRVMPLEILVHLHQGLKIMVFKLKLVKFVGRIIIWFLLTGLGIQIHHKAIKFVVKIITLLIPTNIGMQLFLQVVKFAGTLIVVQKLVFKRILPHK